MLTAAALLAALLVSQDTAPSSRPRPTECLVVLNKNDANVSLIDPRSGETITQLPVGIGPHEAACSPDGETLVVCNYGDQRPGSTLTVIDLAKRQVRSTIDLAPNRRPHGIAFLPDGKTLAITAETEKRLLLVDLEQQKVAATIPTNASVSHMVVLAPDGKRAFTTNLGSGSVSALDLEGKKLIKVLATDKGCEGIAWRPGTNELWVTNREANTLSIIDTDELEVTGSIPCGTFPLRIAFTQDGRHALVACTKSDAVAVIDAQERKPKQRIELAAGSAPAGILLSADGKRAFVAQMYAASLAEIDVATFTVVRTVATGEVPDGMAWSKTAGQHKAERG